MICTLHIFSGDQLKKNVIGGCVERRGGRRGAYRFLVGRPEGKKPLARSRFR
jgi:hypothetical protein